MLVRVLGITVSSLCLALTAAADGFYAELNVGPSFWTDSDISGGGGSGEVRFDPGFNIGGAAGSRFLDHFRAELNLNYRRAEVDEINGGTITVGGSGDAGVFAAMANGYFDIDLGLPVKPYVGAGIGVGVVMFDAEADGNLLDMDDTSTEFAWNAMGGISYALNGNWVLSGGYRYFSTTDASIDSSAIGPGSFSLDTEIGVHEVVFGARYEF